MARVASALTVASRACGGCGEFIASILIYFVHERSDFFFLRFSEYAMDKLLFAEYTYVRDRQYAIGICGAGKTGSGNGMVAR